MILYFSATGNSEYVARNIAYLNNDEVVNMTDYLKKNEVMNLTSENPYVIIAPVYISTLPVIVMELLEKSTFNGNKNVYFIMTCAGSGISGAGAFAKPIAEKLGLTYRGIELRNYIEQKHPNTVSESSVCIHTDLYWDERMKKLMMS